MIKRADGISHRFNVKLKDVKGATRSSNSQNDRQDSCQKKTFRTK